MLGVVSDPMAGELHSSTIRFVREVVAMEATVVEHETARE
jgi:hypothetical protein